MDAHVRKFLPKSGHRLFSFQDPKFIVTLDGGGGKTADGQKKDGDQAAPAAAKKENDASEVMAAFKFKPTTPAAAKPAAATAATPAPSAATTTPQVGANSKKSEVGALSSVRRRSLKRNQTQLLEIYSAPGHAAFPQAAKPAKSKPPVAEAASAAPAPVEPAKPTAPVMPRKRVPITAPPEQKANPAAATAVVAPMASQATAAVQVC